MIQDLKPMDITHSQQQFQQDARDSMPSNTNPEVLGSGESRKSNFSRVNKIISGHISAEVPLETFK